MARFGAQAISRSDPAVAFLTPQWVESWRAQGNNADLRYFGESEAIHNKPAVNVDGTLDRQYLGLTEVLSPAPFVAEIPSGRVVGEHGAVVTPDNLLLQDVSWPDWAFDSTWNSDPDLFPGAEDFFSDARLPIRHLRGTVALLTSYFGRGYFHWMFDVLPRLGLLEGTGYRRPEVDYFVVPMRFSGFQVETLESLGIPPTRLISSFHSRHIFADRLLAPSLTRPSYVVPTWVIDFIRSKFPPRKPHGTFSSRIYIGRKSTDHGLTANEQDLLVRLQHLGFQVIAMEDYTLNEKAWLLQQAEMVIGPSGAGLNNVVFCNRGTKVIELRVRPYPTPETWDIANRCGLEFFEVLPENYVANGRGRPMGSVSVQSVLETLETAGFSGANLSPNRMT
jgi:hypothetical protein